MVPRSTPLSPAMVSPGEALAAGFPRILLVPGLPVMPRAGLPG
jgi:hypothetical protein